jgi:multidrug efflux pump subunit AcrA (membrane-fusion protein)
MLAEVVLYAAPFDSAQGATSNVIAVPEQALIRTGGRDLAIIALGGGRFRPREVRVGRMADGYAEILEGLSEGDSLVTSAQFLIDSESNLRAAVEQLRAGGPHAGHAP